LAEWNPASSEYLTHATLVREPGGQSVLVTSGSKPSSSNVKMWSLPGGEPWGGGHLKTKGTVWALAGYEYCTPDGEALARVAILYREGRVEIWQIDSPDDCLGLVQLGLEESEDLSPDPDHPVPCLVPFEGGTRLLVAHPLGLRVVDLIPPTLRRSVRPDPARTQARAQSTPWPSRRSGAWSPQGTPMAR
jgi:hypothetical protein